MRNATVALEAAKDPAGAGGLWTTHYVDVSDNNGAVDWRQVARDAKATGITGAALKASEGKSEVDPDMPRWREECARVGLRVMLYHFARPDVNTPVQDAEHFCSVVGHLNAWEWRPMLDHETQPIRAEWAQEWAAVVRKRLGVAPVLYSYFSALHNIAPKPILDGLVLAYPNGIPASAPVPSPWRRWVAHQYSWNGHVRGIDGGVDLNYSPAVRSLLAFPVRGAAYEPVFRRRRRAA